MIISNNIYNDGTRTHNNNDNKCVIVEEILISTFVCDLLFLFDNYALFNKTSKNLLTLNILNENQNFQIIDNHKLMTRGRIDREQYVFEKLCRNINADSNSYREDYSLNEGGDPIEDPSQIDCTIILEFALISQNRTFKPILINIPVNIQDINDNTPRFDQYTSGLKLELSEDISTIDQHYLLSMLTSSASTTSSSLMPSYWAPSITTESSLLHSSISSKKREIATLPLAKDFDYGLNGTVAYKLEGPDAEYFELLNHTIDSQYTNSLNPKFKNIKSLHLISRFTLDRERKSEYRLILLAFDQSPKIRHTAQLPINIYVKEVNEYAPQFNLGVNITDNQQSDTIQQILNNEHNIIGHPNRFHSQVRIKSFSKLFLGKQQSQKNQVSESSNHIQLPNSNYLTLGLPEDINVGSRIYRVQAIDFDSIDLFTINDQYSYQPTHPRITVHYFIAQETDLGVKHYFRLGKEDGWITLLQRLDYESGSRTYILPIVAVDFGRPQLSNTLTLTIQVLDVNDEAPSITIRGIEPTRTNYNYRQQQHIIGHSTLNSFNSAHFQVVTVRENSPVGTFIAKVSARDRDTGIAGEVECYLNEAENFGRKILDTSHSFNFDYSKNLHNFQLHPVNDDSIYTGTISENIEPIASSTYIQYPTSNILGRHDIEYILETKTILDREDKSSYFISIICHDYAEKLNNINYEKNYPTLQINNIPSSSSLKHRLSSRKLLKINILDENDNGPQFDRLRYEVKIFENSPENTELIQLNAIDNDEVKQINYRFFEYTDQLIENYTDLNLTYLHFKIDLKTGLIKTTNIPLDREVKDSILIPVIAYDDEYPNRTTHTWIYVQIEDVNDNIPQLIGNTTFWIDEESSILEQLVSSINHSRINNNNNNNITKIIGTRQYYSNHHIFIGHLNGEDQDIGENGQIIFTLGFENQYNSPKWILHSDGNLFVQSTMNNEQSYLDREKASFYEIPIIISDLGKNPTLSSTATVTVSLKDVNDNSPKFIKPSYSQTDFNFHMNISQNIQSSLSRRKFKMFNIPSERINLLSIDNTNPGTLIYSVEAIDYDDGNNGKIMYKLDVYEGYWQLADNSLNTNNSKSSRDYFIIDETSGEIRINKPITIDNLQIVPKCLIITAEDCGIPSRRNYALLYIDFINEETRHSFNKTYNHFNRSLLNINNNNLNANLTAVDLTKFDVHHQGQFIELYSNNINKPSSNLMNIDKRKMNLPVNSLSSPKRNYIQSFNTKLSPLTGSSMTSFQLQNNLEKTISAYQNSMNTDQMETISTYQNSTELITGLGIGLVIIILVCLLLLITYAMHGTQTLRLRRNMPTVNRNDAIKQHKTDINNIHNSNNITNQIDRKRNYHVGRWKQFCNVIQLAFNHNHSMNNGTVSKSVETMNSSKLYALSQDTNKICNIHGMAMEIPSSSDWESFHSRFTPADQIQKQISNEKCLYSNKSIDHCHQQQPCIYPQIDTLIPVINSVEMGSEVSKQDTCDDPSNATINAVTANHNQLLVTTISQDELQTSLRSELSTNRYPRIYTLCTSDYMTLNLPDNHHQYIPTNCHFSKNNINLHKSNMTIPKVVSPYDSNTPPQHHHQPHPHEEHESSLLTLIPSSTNSFHYCTSPTQYCRILPIEVNGKSSKLLKNSIQQHTSKELPITNNQLLGIMNSTEQLDNPQNVNDYTSKECYQVNSLKSSSFV
ncbi:hypothetical protein MN116_007735 [Schistosoma mekongi]|uniref:Cadherin domain-containing protein n=1 Tax=Schistosoma mekongi TaxID=38744 RepID=A0AAE1Z7G4_SCHME|nr:hypothetical protein MN116_007735 [Schistosoma mekongi]